MFHEESRLNVADNSGAEEVLIIRVLGGSKKRYAYVGDRVKVTVKKAKSKTKGFKVQKGEVRDAVIVRQSFPIRRPEGYVKYEDNACVLIDPNSGNPIGTRVHGSVAREVRDQYSKICSLAEEVT